MYYLIRNNLEKRQCVDKNRQNVYIDNINIGCGNSEDYPSNIQFLKSIQVNCTGTANPINMDVYCDYTTAINNNFI